MNEECTLHPFAFYFLLVGCQLSVVSCQWKTPTETTEQITDSVGA